MLDDEEQTFFIQGGQANGWIDTALFRNFVENIFAAEVQKQRELDGTPNEPSLLIADGHSSRIGVDYTALPKKTFS